MRIIELTDAPFDPSAALEAITRDCNGAGAIASFTGLVRPSSSTGDVTHLRLEAHPVLTLRGMNEAADQTSRRWPLSALRIVHRVGDIAACDAVVFVATAAPHRRAAFEAVDFLMDYLKTRAVFWKKEIGPQGSNWIEPREQDYSDFARWAATEKA